MTLDVMNLGKEKMQRLVRAAAARGCAEIDKSLISEFDWASPKCFSSKRMKELSSRIQGFAGEIGTKYSGFFNKEFEVKTSGFELKYAKNVVGEINGSTGNNYYLSFGKTMNDVCGIVSLKHDTALYLAMQLLGEDGEHDISRALSELEESLLIDIVSVMVSALPGIDECLSFEAAEKIICNKLPMELNGQEEFFCINLTMGAGGTENKYDGQVLVLCEAMSSMMEVDKTAKEPEMPQSEVSDILMRHLKKTNISIGVNFGTINLSIDEAMDLQEGDIILLNKNIYEPADILMDDRAIFKGMCVKSENKYAVKIIEPDSDNQDA